jgi:hypothetical protein
VKHLSGRIHHQLHRRRSGDSVVSWTKLLLDVAGIKSELTRSSDETFTAILNCDSTAGGAKVRVNTSFGVMLLGKLGG